MNDSVIDIHHGIRFKVEAVPQGELFAGYFTILDGFGRSQRVGRQLPADD